MGLQSFNEELEEEEDRDDDHSFWICPVCLAEQSEWDISCGCFEDIHYGN